MSNCQDIREMMIDSIYGEVEHKEISEHIERCSECRECYEDIRSALKGMEIVEPQIPVPFYDIENLIRKAEHIKTRSRIRLENVVFLISSFSILCFVLFASLKFGSTFILLIQILVYMNLPLVLVPVMRKKELRRESDECI